MWGLGVFGNFTTPNRVKSFKNEKIKDFRISNGGSIFVLTEKGKVYSWGDNSFGQLGQNDHLMRDKPTKIAKLDPKKVTQIAPGKLFAIALGENIEQENTVILR